MCDEADCRHHENRRNFLKVTSAAGAWGLLAASGAGMPVAAQTLTKERRDAMSPDEVLEAMKRGNERFRKGKRENRDVLALQKASIKGQHPRAVLLSCIDSRAPAETILDLSIGDIFNSRLAGNVLNDDVLGGMEFACGVAGSKVVLVMGHTSCGAIKGAIDDVKLGNLTALLAKIQPAVAATKGERSSKNDAYVNAVARKHVELTVEGIRKRSPVLAELESKGRIRIAGSMYSLETGAVDFFV